jgi:hypothetical protein
VNSPSNFMDAFLSDTGCSPSFQFTYDHSGLTSPPQEGYDLVYASLGDPSSSNSWLPLFEAPRDDYPSTGENIAHDANHHARNVSNQLTPQQQQEMLQFLDFNYQSDFNSPSSNVDSSSRSTSYSAATPETTSSTYAPPPGAANVGRRVVGSSWKLSGVSMKDSPPPSPVEYTTTQWGVRAVS